MDKKEEQFLYKLSNADGTSGHEGEIREIFKEEVKPYTSEVDFDGLGSVVAKYGQNGPRILVASHMDEVGFMVTKITDEGFIEFQTIGGWWAQVMLAQQVTITTRNGDKILGVTGSKPPHVLSAEARNKVYDINDMFIDLGMSSKKEVENLGIRPGDMITPKIEARRMNGGKFLLGKAWDNRIGTAIVLKVLENLAKEENTTNQMFLGADVQEEVGLRGAQTLTHMVNPDLSFAVDTGTAGDTPGMTAKEADSILGKGPQILIFDASMIPHQKLLNFVTDIADELKIPYQLTVIAGGGTDAGKMHLSHNGVPSLAVTVPVRYLHSHTSIIHEDDYLNTVKLLTEVAKRLDDKTVAEIKAY
jgi:Cellulase M and related proteins